LGRFKTTEDSSKVIRVSLPIVSSGSQIGEGRRRTDTCLKFRKIARRFPQNRLPTWFQFSPSAVPITEVKVDACACEMSIVNVDCSGQSPFSHLHLLKFHHQSPPPGNSSSLRAHPLPSSLFLHTRFLQKDRIFASLPLVSPSCLEPEEGGLLNKLTAPHGTRLMSHKGLSAQAHAPVFGAQLSVCTHVGKKVPFRISVSFCSGPLKSPRWDSLLLEDKDKQATNTWFPQGV